MFSRFLALLLAAPLLTGCGTMRNGRRWGQDATLLPGWSRLGHAVVDSVVEPSTWVPLAAAAALQIGDTDNSIAEWAHDSTPLFGSNQAADDASDFLAEATKWASLGTSLLAPGGDQPGPWLYDKAKGLGLEYAASYVSDETTMYLKDISLRTRPDRSNNHSFPSAHSSAAALHATFASRNIGAMELPDRAESIADFSLIALEAGTAWGRVEADKHYPSDVLAGLAIGHFFAEFFDRAFLGIENRDRPHVTAFTDGRDSFIGVSQSF